MEFDFTPHTRIIMPEEQRQTIIEHCLRKMRGPYLAGETGEKKAFGLVFGTRSETVLTITGCVPLLKNARTSSQYKEVMDRIINEYALPSQTKAAQRGWIADPEELFVNIRIHARNNVNLIATYHLHLIAWKHDPRRDTPTVLDSMLARKSRLYMLIVSMVNPSRPIIRAFYEGIKTKEAKIVTASDRQVGHEFRLGSGG